MSTSLLLVIAINNQTSLDISKSEDLDLSSGIFKCGPLISIQRRFLAYVKIIDATSNTLSNIGTLFRILKSRKPIELIKSRETQEHAVDYLIRYRNTLFQ